MTELILQSYPTMQEELMKKSGLNGNLINIMVGFWNNWVLMRIL